MKKKLQFYILAMWNFFCP